MKQHNTMLTCLSEQSVYTPKKYKQLVRGCPLIPHKYKQKGQTL